MMRLEKFIPLGAMVKFYGVKVFQMSAVVSGLMKEKILQAMFLCLHTDIPNYRPFVS